MIAGVIPKLSALVAHHGVAIAAGALSGAALGGAGVATGIIPVGGGQGGPTLALLACPGSGAEVARVTSGEPLLVTARSADGSWLQIYIPGPGIDRGWAPTDALKMQAAVAGLPVADCAAPPTLPPLTPAPVGSPSPVATQIVLPTTSPEPSPSPSPTPKPTPKPTRKPTPKPTGTPFIDLTAPTITNLINDGDGNTSDGWSIYRPSATCSPHFSTISATVTDPDDAIKSVTVYYTTYGATSETSAPMVKVSSTKWQYVLNAQDSWIEGQIAYHVKATDAHGNSTDQMYDLESYNLYLGHC